MNISLSNKALALSLAVLISAPAFSEDTRTLILRETANPNQTLEITLEDFLGIQGADGNLEGFVESLPNDCPDPGGPGLSCDDVTVGPVTFGVSPGITVTAGQTLTFNWGSRGAFECEALDGENSLPGWGGRTLVPDSRDATTAARTISTTNLARTQPYVARLRCRNGPVLGAGDGQTTIRSLNITVNPANGGGDPSLPAFCSEPTRQMPSNWTRMASGNLSCVTNTDGVVQTGIDCRQWGSIWTAPFWTGGGTRRISTGRGPNPGFQYIAAEFSTDGLPTSAVGTYTGAETPGLGPSSAIVSISQCPGDFDRAALGDCMGTIRTTSGFGWRTAASNATGTRCVLEPGRRYFLNIVFSNQANQGPAGLSGITSQTVEPNPNCAGSPCGLVINPL